MVFARVDVKLNHGFFARIKQIYLKVALQRISSCSMRSYADFTGRSYVDFMSRGRRKSVIASIEHFNNESTTNKPIRAILQKYLHLGPNQAGAPSANARMPSAAAARMVADGLTIV